MKKIMWLGIFLLSLSWLFLLPIYSTPQTLHGILILAAGITCTTLALWKTPVGSCTKKYFLILIPLIISVFFLDFPYNIGSILLTLGIALYMLIQHKKRSQQLGWIPAGIILSGIIFIIQTAFTPFYTTFSAHFHRIDWLSPLVSWTGGLLGLKTTLSSGIVFIQTTSKAYPFTTTLEKLGVFPWLLIATAAALILFFTERKQRVKNTLFFLSISSVYLLLRYVFLIFVFTASNDFNIFWNPWYLFFSFLPLALLFMRFLPLNRFYIETTFLTDVTCNRRHVLTVILIFIMIFSTVGAIAYHDPGVEKQGRILIDEFHSDWEGTTRPLDKEWYGQLSTYNYYSWAEWLNYYYDVHRNINNTLTPHLLNNYDILIIKCPTSLFSQEEINAVLNFVEDGGGLYVIGDHTNVFGMNFYANQILQYFDMQFKYDATYDLETGDTSVYQSSNSVFTHPIMQATPSFGFLTSCTIEAPLTAEHVIVGTNLAAESGTYSTEYFFRESHNAADMEHGSFLQTMAVKHGKGRVVAFTDSTCFSNFCVFKDGYTTFNLGVTEYLNQKNAYQHVNTIFLAVAIASFLGIGYLLWNEHKTLIILMFIVIGLIGFMASAPLFNHLNQSNYSLPSMKPDANYTKISFLTDHSDFKLSSSPRTPFADTSNMFGTFFVWTQRVGYLPSLEDSISQATTKADSVVIINPNKSFTKAETNRITQYVEQGGTLLLLDSILNINSTSNDLLQNFGIWLTKEHRVQSANITGNNSMNITQIGNTTQPYLSIIGGTPIIKGENNQTTIVTSEKGDGKVVVMVDSYTFSDKVMGGAFTKPNSFQRSVYNTEFHILEDLLFDD